MIALGQSEGPEQNHGIFPFHMAPNDDDFPPLHDDLACFLASRSMQRRSPYFSLKKQGVVEPLVN